MVAFFKKPENFEESVLKNTESNNMIAEIKVEKESKKTNRKKHIIKIVKSITPIILCIFFVVILNTMVVPYLNYNKAVKLVNEQKYDDALFLFNKLGDYKDSKNKMLDIAIELSNEKDVKEAITAFGILSNYKQLLQYAIKCSNNINKNFSISTGACHTIGLKKDGTVVATGYNEYGQCNVSEWKDIVAVSAGGGHTIGLKKDGTVVATGDNKFGQCNVLEWSDIVAVSAGYGFTLGLKLNGTVVAAGYNEYGQCNVSEWKDIVAVSAGGNHSVGLKENGTVVAVGNNTDGQANVQYEHDAIAIAAGLYETAIVSSWRQLNDFGIVGATFHYYYENISHADWRDLTSVSVDDHVVG